MEEALLSELLTEILIPVVAICGIVFSLLQWFFVSQVKMTSSGEHHHPERHHTHSDRLIEEGEDMNDHGVVAKCAEIQTAISEGATSFLFTEYKFAGLFMSGFAVLIFLFLGSVEGFSTKEQPCTYGKDTYCKPALANAVFSTVAFILGAGTSLLSGFFGMKIATYANARTTLEARKGVGKAFITAFRSGSVMGFLLASSGLLVLYITILLFKLYYGDDWEGLFEAITGYGLGGSSMALFGRVGGGIYTKAADVGADLVGKVEKNIPEDDPRNPAVIADNVGDNVGDIAGMGSDLFGSYAESSCAALVVASISSFGNNHDLTAMCFPLLISSMGIIVCLVTTLFATDFFEIKEEKEIEPTLKKQLIISTVLMTIGIAIITWIALPSSFTILRTKLKGHQKKVTGLAFSQSMNILVSSGADAQLCVWSIDGWEKKKTRFIQPPANRSSSQLVGDTKVQFHNDQTHLLVVHESQLSIYEDSKLECLRSWSPRESLAAPISSAVYSCDGSLVFAGFCDGAIGVFDSDGLRIRCRIAPSAYISPIPSGMVFPMVIAAHPTELNQIALGMSDGSVNVIEPSDAEQKWGVCSPFENGGGGGGSGPIAPLPLIPPNQSLNNNNNPTSEPPTSLS